MKKIFILLVAVGLAVVCPFLFAGGQQESGTFVEEKRPSVTVTDVLGRQVCVDLPVRSIAFTHYASAEAFKILGGWDLVVARDGYTNDPLVYPGVADIPALGSMMDGPYTPDQESLLELNPDLLILEVIPMPGIEDLIEDLDGIIPVVAVKTYDPNGMAESFRTLGKLLGRSERAEDFIAWCTDVQNMMLGQTADMTDAEKAKIFFKTGYGEVDSLMTFSDDMSYIPARNRITGCINIAGDLPSQGGWVPGIDPEWLASKDYDVLVIGDPQPGRYGTAASDTEYLSDFRQKVMELPIFAGTTAVKDGRVYMLSDTFFGTPRHIIGFAYLAKWFHPGLFGEMNPAQLHQEYFDKFLEVDADVINSGIFVYPRG